MKVARAALLVLALLALPVASGAATPEASGTLDVRSFHLAAGEAMQARGALRIVAHGPATIAGTLRGDGSNPIEVVADGPIVVRGRILGGQGAASEPGGGVTLSSRAGVVRIQRGAVIAAGNGGDALVRADVAGAAAPDGGRGGDVAIDAANVVLDGLIRVGSGGRGGHAGAMHAQAGNGGDSGNVIYDGDIAAIRDRIDGGRGGDGGHGSAVAPPALGGGGASAGACLPATPGTNGVSANPAKPGKPAPAPVASPGVSVTATGGDGAAGGNGAGGATGVTGSSAMVVGGPGGPGSDGCPGAIGGNGGRAQARGGDGGDSTLGVGGAGGDATAIGGDGGPGGDGGAGGQGGTGGAATLVVGGIGGTGGDGGPGGDGGDGGDVCAQGGAGGTGPGGTGPAGTATATPGAAGPAGDGGAAGPGGTGGASLLGLTDGPTGLPGGAGPLGEIGLPGDLLPTPCFGPVRISVDPYTGGPGQHRTQVEPDSFAFGSTMVTAFQVARVFGGGANNVGFSTSQDNGVSWTDGMLPLITVEEGGPWAKASDPAVAYDAEHDVWLIQTLAIDAVGNPREVLVSRSTDGGLTWGPPITAGGGPTRRLDKNWIVCDNWPGSPHFGNCYSQWDDNGAGNRMEMATSTDGGLTWGPTLRPSDQASGLGGQPVVQPDGDVIVPYSGNFGSVRSFMSTNGGASWGSSVTVSSVTRHSPAGSLRSPPLPSAEVSGDGTVYVTWMDCRFRSGCPANDIVMSKSTDGTTWTAPVRIPIDPVDSGIDHFIPGLAVNPATSGSGTDLFLVYYQYPIANCGGSCTLQVGFGWSTDAGATWSFETHAPLIPISWVANSSQGRMVGDYISASFLDNGRAVPIWSHAYEPAGGLFDQAMEVMMGGFDITTGSVAAGGDQPAEGVIGAPPPATPPTAH